SLGARVGRSLHENEVLAVDEAVRGQNGDKGLPTLVGRAHRGAVDEQPHAIDFARLLRARRGRPRGSCAAEQRDALAPVQLIELHSVPLSARAGCRISNWQRLVSGYPSHFTTACYCRSQLRVKTGSALVKPKISAPTSGPRFIIYRVTATFTARS